MSLRDPFTAVLLCLGLVSAAVFAWGTASVILLLVVVSCVLRATGEHRAGRSTAALRDLVATTATVVRRADEDAPPVRRELPPAELVPGDVVRLGPGDLVPADVRLLRAHGLTVHQSALTGESAPVAKSASDAPHRAGGEGGPSARAEPGVGEFAQRQCCFQGSSVVSGTDRPPGAVLRPARRRPGRVRHRSPGGRRPRRAQASAGPRGASPVNCVWICAARATGLLDCAITQPR